MEFGDKVQHLPKSKVKVWSRFNRFHFFPQQKKGFKKTLFPKILSRLREKEPKKNKTGMRDKVQPLPRSKVKV
jgi:hypothetical protein